MRTAVEMDSALSSRESLAFCPAVSSRSSVSGQLRLETSHLTRGDADDLRTMKSKSFGKSVTHSSSALMIKHSHPQRGFCLRDRAFSVYAR
jgi:hypothetical protein